MKEGDILLYKGEDNLLQRCIKKVTKSEFVHCGVIESVNKNDVWTGQAYYNGFVKRYYEKYELDYLIKEGKVEIRRPNVKIEDVYYHMEKYLGIKYGFFQLVVILIKAYTGITIHKDGLKHLICSEAVSRVEYDSSKKLLDFQKEFNKDYDLITPGDIAVSKQVSKI